MYNEVLEAFLELKKLMSEKKEAIIHKKLEELASIDESTLILSEKISKFDLGKMQSTFSEEEKQELKKLGQEIKILQEILYYDIMSGGFIPVSKISQN